MIPIVLVDVGKLTVWAPYIYLLLLPYVDGEYVYSPPPVGHLVPFQFFPLTVDADFIGDFVGEINHVRVITHRHVWDFVMFLAIRGVRLDVRVRMISPELSS